MQVKPVHAGAPACTMAQNLVQPNPSALARTKAPDLLPDTHKNSSRRAVSIWQDCDSHWPCIMLTGQQAPRPPLGGLNQKGREGPVTPNDANADKGGSRKPGVCIESCSVFWGEDERQSAGLKAASSAQYQSRYLSTAALQHRTQCIMGYFEGF